MPVGAFLRTLAGTVLHTEKIGRHTHLITEDHSRVATQFKVARTTSAATTIVVSPRGGGALVVTDLIVNQDKVASGVVTVQFTDGANTEIFFQANTKDAPVSNTSDFEGRMRGWKDARVEMVSAGTNPTTNVTVMYYHLRGTGALSFADWDAQR